MTQRHIIEWDRAVFLFLASAVDASGLSLKRWSEFAHNHHLDGAFAEMLKARYKPYFADGSRSMS
jgi:hypothetical protein